MRRTANATAGLGIIAIRFCTQAISMLKEWGIVEGYPISSNVIHLLKSAFWASQVI
jgi:hypothetical protein